MFSSQAYLRCIYEEFVLYSQPGEAYAAHVNKSRWNVSNGTELVHRISSASTQSSSRRIASEAF